MQIKRLEIKGFGKLENREFTLGPRFNVIYGRNEAGKSTLQAFVKGMLYGLKGGRRLKDGSLPPMKKYQPWHGKHYGGIITYTMEDGRLFTVGRNFEKNTISISDEFGNTITSQFPASRDEGVKFAEQHLGLSESCYERTAFIGQLQSAVDSEGRKILAERLVNLRQGADEGVSYRKAMQVLKEAQLSQVGSGRTLNRPLNWLESQLEAALHEEKRLNELHQSSMALFTELEQRREENEQLKSELVRLQQIQQAILENAKTDALHDALLKLSECDNKISGLTRRLSELDTALDELRKKQQHLAYYQSFSHRDIEHMVEEYTRLSHAQLALQQCQSKYEQNETRIKQTRQVLDRYAIFNNEGAKIAEVLAQLLNENNATKVVKPYTKKRANVFPVLGIVVSTVYVLALLVFWDRLTEMLRMIALGILLFTGTGILPIAKLRKGGKGFDKNTLVNENRLKAWMDAVEVSQIHEFIELKSMFADKKRYLDELLTEKERLTKQESEIQSQVTLLEASIQKRLQQAGAGGEPFSEAIPLWKKNVEQVQHIEQAMLIIDNERALLLQKQEGFYQEASFASGTTIGSLHALKEAIWQLEHELQYKQLIPVDDRINLLEVEKQIQQLEQTIQSNQTKITMLSTRLESIPDGEQLQLAHEQVHRLQVEKAHKLFLGKALETAMEGLTQASLAISRDYAPALNKEMGDILFRLTDGRYGDVKVDDSLTLKLLPDELTERVTPEQLSSGTVDQIYLALRLAAVRLVEQAGERIPLFLDEPFAQYDEIRIQNALRLLLDECRHRQIFLLVCKERDLELVQRMTAQNDVHIVDLNQ